MPPPPAEPAHGEATVSHSSGEGRPWLAATQRWLDRLLVVDVFLVLAGALWFGLGVALHLRGLETLLTSFQRAWPVIFQPAIGLLMAAALLSGGLGWWRRRGQR